jgi:hydroxymethylpyrimidine/phosphomethylpyrimidine kinase
MQTKRSIVLSIAGFDPSGGAGILADIKTFEQHKVYGLAVITGVTLQTESEFASVRWESEADIIEGIEKMLGHYSVTAIKIGLVENAVMLQDILSAIQAFGKRIPVIVDPVITSSTGYGFWENEGVGKELLEKFRNILLLTPNFKEVLQLSSGGSAKEAARKLSAYCNVLLKGGHNNEEPGMDYLFTAEGIQRIPPSEGVTYPKHGSGCVLSASIAANIAIGFGLAASCTIAKKYAEEFLRSNETLLGYHNA